ncbi:MAG: hypothetical protein ACU833_09565 [Gammaproteobacteria bacterium]
MKYLGLFLLSVWLIGTGIADLFKFHFVYDKWIWNGFALASGAVLLLNSFRTLFSDLGLTVLSAWLILFSTMQMFKYSYTYSSITLSSLGIIAGILIIAKK